MQTKLSERNVLVEERIKGERRPEEAVWQAGSFAMLLKLAIMVL
jgi:hypothetical protein